MKDNLKIVLVVLGIFLLFSPLILEKATAQTQPDAGTLLQQQRQPESTLPDRLPTDDEKKESTPVPMDSNFKIMIQGFRFTGNEGIATEGELQNLVQEFIGQKLGFTDLQKILKIVTNYLKDKKGYLLARAYLPKQHVTGGIIEIAIIIGRVDGKIEIRVQDPKRIKKSLLEGIAERSLPADTAVRMDNIEQAVLLMNDLPGMEASASLESGKYPGSTRIIIDAKEGPLLHGVLSANNYGDRYTGAARIAVQALAYDPSGLADLISIGYTGAERLNNFHAAYTLPLGSTGLTWNTTYTGLNYRLGKEIEDLNAKGKANTVNSGITYSLLRTRKASIWTGISAEYLVMVDEANEQKTRDRKLFLGEASLTGSFFDRFNGGGLTNISFILTGGDVNLSGLQSYQQSDDAGASTSGSFYRLNYIGARLQRLTRQTAFFISLRGQFASHNLDSSQKLLLGGSTGIRAYPAGEGSGDEGHLMTVEARYDLPFMPSWFNTQLIGFFDTGWIKLHNKPWAGSLTNIDGRNDYILSGGGIGLNIGKAGLYSLRVSYAHKVGPNDGCTATGKDSDNTDYNDRYWLQFIVWL